MWLYKYRVSYNLQNYEEEKDVTIMCSQVCRDVRKSWRKHRVNGIGFIPWVKHQRAKKLGCFRAQEQCLFIGVLYSLQSLRLQWIFLSRPWMQAIGPNHVKNIVSCVLSWILLCNTFLLEKSQQLNPLVNLSNIQILACNLISFFFLIFYKLDYFII